jgi:hypothetical protein
VTNKTDHGILLNPDKFYLNDEEAWVSMENGSITPDAGKSGTYSFNVAINTMPEHTALDSLDELYGLEGTFDGLNTYDDNNNTNLEVSFSIPDALGAASDGDTTEMQTSAESGAVSDLYGTWEVVEVDSGTYRMTVEEMEDGLVYSWSDWSIIVSETGQLYLQTNNTSVINEAEVASSGIVCGSNEWVPEDGRLVLHNGDTVIYYEKVSDSQEFPSLTKEDLMEALQGTWEIQSDEREGYVTFSDKTAEWVINGVQLDDNTVSILMEENRINLRATVDGKYVSMNFDYTYEDGVLTLGYSGDSLVKQ